MDNYFLSLLLVDNFIFQNLDLKTKQKSAEDPARENRFWYRRRRLQKLRGDLIWKSFICQAKQMITKIINPSLSVPFFINPEAFFLPSFFCWKLKRFFSFFVFSCANPGSHPSPFSSFSLFECLSFCTL